MGSPTARACDIGDSLQIVLERFAADVESAVVVVAHNISFDAGILRTEFKRTNLLALSRINCKYMYHAVVNRVVCRLPKI